MTIRESIAFYQKQAKITNTTLYKECGINKSSYSLYKRGIRNLPYEKLQQIFDFLNLEVCKRDEAFLK